MSVFGERLECAETPKKKNKKSEIAKKKFGSRLVVGRLIELVDHYSLRAIRVDHQLFCLYSINQYVDFYGFYPCWSN